MTQYGGSYDKCGGSCGSMRGHVMQYGGSYDIVWEVM